MNIKIETTPNTFVIISNERLTDLRISLKGCVLNWHEKQASDSFEYMLTNEELLEFFEPIESGIAFIKYEDEGETKELSVNKHYVKFGDVLSYSTNKNTISMYISMTNTVRVGWNRNGNTKAFVTDATVDTFVMQNDGLVVTATIKSRFFVPKYIEVYATGRPLLKPLLVHLAELDTSIDEDNNVISNIKFVMAKSDIASMFEGMTLHEFVEKSFIFKFKFLLNQYRVSKNTVDFRVDKELVLDNPVMFFEHQMSQDLALTSKVFGSGNVMFSLVTLLPDEFDKIRERLLEDSEQPVANKTVLLDQGTQKDRHHLRVLFKDLMKKQVSDVYLLTDGRFMDELPTDVLQNVVFANTFKHIDIYPQIKTLITMGNRHDAMPLRVQRMQLVMIKHHVGLIENLKIQIDELGFNIPKKGQVDLMLANEQDMHQIKQISQKSIKLHLTGLPGFSEFESKNPQGVGRGIGVLISDELRTEMATIANENKLIITSIDSNLHDYKVIVTDNEDMAYRASVLGVPVVYLNKNLTPDAVDHYYRFSGPVIRDVKTGAYLLQKVFDDTFDFKPYIERANHNLNAFHDTESSERIEKVLGL